MSKNSEYDFGIYYNVLIFSPRKDQIAFYILQMHLRALETVQCVWCTPTVNMHSHIVCTQQHNAEGPYSRVKLFWEAGRMDQNLEGDI